MQSTAWPPPELFPLSPNENGIDIKPNVYDANGVISYTRRPDFTPAIGGVVNGDLNKNRPYQTGKHLPDSSQGHRTGIKEAMSIKCSGTFVTVCTFRSHYFIFCLYLWRGSYLGMKRFVIFICMRFRQSTFASGAKHLF